MLLECTVCHGTFPNKSEWLGHLPLPSHLTLARKQLPSWDEATRASVLVIFAKLEVGKDDRIIKHLSKGLGVGTFVTDFVWWGQRPRVGFVQFESKSTLKKVLASLNNLQFRIEPDQVCQVRDGGTISELEWSQLHPDPAESGAVKALEGQQKQPQASTSTTPPEKTSPCDYEPPPKKRLKLKAEPKPGKHSPDTGDTPPAPREKKGTSQSLESSTSAPTPEHSLRGHLASIRKLIEIPDEEYNTALDITRRLQQLLDEVKPKKGSKNKRDAETTEAGASSEREAVISRHWSLKLQYSPKIKDKNIPFGLLICKYNLNYEDPLAAAVEMQELKALEKKLITTGKGGKKLFLSYQVISTRHELDSKSGFFSTLRYCIVEPTTRLPFQVSILSDRRLLVEAQVWRLFEYLCTFDPHCAPVLQLVYYWAKVNSITVGKTSGAHDCLSDPSGLNWLLILFFKQEGLIPSPGGILKMPREAKLFNGVDIGFADCSKFTRVWKSSHESAKSEGEEQFAEEVFQLLCKFFHFCTSQLGRPTSGGCGYVVNTRDAQVIPAQKLWSTTTNVTTMENCKLTEIELDKIKKPIFMGGKKKYAKIIMIHPFFPNWRISAASAGPAFDAMRKTGMKLKDHFQPNVNKGAGVKREPLGFTEFLSLLII